MNKITWIISTGNSDIQILNHAVWNGMLSKYKNSNPKYKLKNHQPSLNPKFKINGKIPYLLETRVLGAVAQSAADYEKLSLTFPLLDGFAQKLENESIKPNEIIVFLTDQSLHFSDKDKLEISCPFWQDTSEAESIFKWYFENKEWFKDTILNFQILQPKTFGLSSWDSTLPFLQEVFNKISSEEGETVYVSHQAGTPAISSAIQFMSLNRFGNNANFLVGNEFSPDSVDVLESSQYLKFLFIGQAKELLKKGNPAAAFQLLNDLVDKDILAEINKQVKMFNLKPEYSERDDEFKPLAAAQRVRDALDLIEIFLENENYLQAIALLAAAHETFLKASISFCFEVNTNFLNSKPRKPKTIVVNGKVLATSKVLQWNNQGLTLSFSYIQRQLNDQSISSKIETLRELNFPTSHPDENIDFENKLKDPEKRKKIDLRNVGSNNALVAWIQEITSIKTWRILDWIGTYKRPFEDDLRNQLMHNLRGIEEVQLKGYLKGFPENWQENQDPRSVLEIFQEEVRSPFIQAMHHIGLITTSDESTNHIQEQLKALGDRLSESPQEPKK